MSRLGKKPVELPSGVEVKVERSNVVTVKGAKGELTQTFSEDIEVTVDGEAKQVFVNATKRTVSPKPTTDFTVLLSKTW